MTAADIAIALLLVCIVGLAYCVTLLPAWMRDIAADQDAAEDEAAEVSGDADYHAAVAEDAANTELWDHYFAATDTPAYWRTVASQEQMSARERQDAIFAANEAARADWDTPRGWQA